MATIQNARDLALQATSPRVAAMPLSALGLQADLADASQVINNLPGYTRVNGLTNLATQTTLANGGGYLTGFGAVSGQNALALGGGYLLGFGNVAGQNVLSLGSGYLSGFGAVAGQNTLDINAYTTGNLSGARITLGTLTVDRLQSGVGTFADTDLSFALSASLLYGYNNCAIGGRSSTATKYGGQFFNSATSGVALVASAYDGTAFSAVGGFNQFSGAITTSAQLGLTNFAGSFVHVGSGNSVSIASSAYALEISSGKLRYGGITIDPPPGAGFLTTAYLDAAGKWRTVEIGMSGSGTATFNGSNKPGGNTTNSWKREVHNGVEGLVPWWPVN